MFVNVGVFEAGYQKARPVSLAFGTDSDSANKLRVKVKKAK